MLTGSYTIHALGLILALVPAAAALQIALEWTPGAGTRSITSASSMLRVANETAPPQTEWLALGWAYGSLGLQRHSGNSDSIVMQLTPPSAAFQAIVGRAADSVEARHRPAAVKDHPPQVLLEAPVKLDPALAYYFKVQAHHDIGLNRTTYEGLYSVGDTWQYLGSLVLQHPTASPSAATSTTDAVSTKEALAALSHFVSTEDNTSTQKTTVEKEEEERTDSGSDSDSDSGSDSDSDTEQTDGVWRPKHNKEMFARPAPQQDSSDDGAFRNSALSDFIRAGFQALRSPFDQQTTSSAPATAATSTQLDDLASVLSLAAEVSPNKRLTNEISFPEVPVFPHLFSGIQRLDGGDSSLLRAGVFKRFQLRDRLGETFFVTNAHAFVYDAEDADVAIARHYVLASSYLLSIDGPHSDASASEGESSSSTESSATEEEGDLTEFVTETVEESDSSDSSASSK
ncbi:hypothetical protein H4R20_000663 [Coemansia guatemalensis]|uniref:Uncharacterized protein n=1 Tax=Coemansia guatemalensis TaxID=2761395 RepID=A0A9W8I4T0_9FUNG|nr:hypothetical protein H4R20_000663 [Coemansia guatemalensis]